MVPAVEHLSVQVLACKVAGLLLREVASPCPHPCRDGRVLRSQTKPRMSFLFFYLCRATFNPYTIQGLGELKEQPAIILNQGRWRGAF